MLKKSKSHFTVKANSINFSAFLFPPASEVSSSNNDLTIKDDTSTLKSSYPHVQVLTNAQLKRYQGRKRKILNSKYILEAQYSFHAFDV